MRYSGLQREVLSLYRKCLRESRKKPAVSVVDKFWKLLRLNSNCRMLGHVSNPSHGKLCKSIIIY